jgi:hypothetical protein
MPYIDDIRRNHFFVSLDDLKNDMDDINNLSAGDLNYLVFNLAVQYIRLKGKNYNNISDAMKALTGAAHEIERRVLDPYEDAAIKKNGDIQ